MPTTLDRALDQARADWLGGDRGAWSRYLVCVRGTVETDRAAAPAPAREAARMTPRHVRRAKA